MIVDDVLRRITAQDGLLHENAIAHSVHSSPVGSLSGLMLIHKQPLDEPLPGFVTTCRTCGSPSLRERKQFVQDLGCVPIIWHVAREPLLAARREADGEVRGLRHGVALCPSPLTNT